jgi:hypothetical protein
MRWCVLLGVLSLWWCGFSAARECPGLAPGTQAPVVMAGKWICDGKAPVLRGNVFLIHFWFDG